MVGKVAILAGGRGIKNVNIYDPVTRTWRRGEKTPMELHHMQCVDVDGKLWIVSAWTGKFPREQNVADIHIYDPATDSWSTKPGLPLERQRGSTAVVKVGRRVYVSHGNRGGHEQADFAVSLGWLDYYEIDEERWVTGLPDAPNPRDHTGGVLIGNRICVSGGRDSGTRNFFANVIGPTDCFNLETEEWEVEADIPVPRAGASYGRTCDGKLMIAGGEGSRPEAYSEVDVFDGKSWTTIEDLNIARHGSGLAMNCECQQIHIASGSGARGGGPELTSVETYYENGIATECSA